jgi:TRAP-type C4-dicarboxylate transport system permease small subunit
MCYLLSSVPPRHRYLYAAAAAAVCVCVCVCMCACAYVVTHLQVSVYATTKAKDKAH